MIHDTPHIYEKKNNKNKEPTNYSTMIIVMRNLIKPLCIHITLILWWFLMMGLLITTMSDNIGRKYEFQKQISKIHDDININNNNNNNVLFELQQSSTMEINNSQENFLSNLISPMNFYQYWLVPGLSILFLQGPSLAGIGFWKGSRPEDICKSIGLSTSRHWSQHKDACVDMIYIEFNSFIVSLHVICMLIITWYVLHYIHYYNTHILPMQAREDKIVEQFSKALSVIAHSHSRSHISSSTLSPLVSFSSSSSSSKTK